MMTKIFSDVTGGNIPYRHAFTPGYGVANANMHKMFDAATQEQKEAIMVAYISKRLE